MQTCVLGVCGQPVVPAATSQYTRQMPACPSASPLQWRARAGLLRKQAVPVVQALPSAWLPDGGAQ